MDFNKLKLACCVCAGCYGLPVADAIADYSEPGRRGVPESWRSPEFNSQWGLASIKAEYAYARGYTGKGITIGIIDQTPLDHPEYAAKITRLGDTSYNYSFDSQNNARFGDHGTHVTGIAAANRDGTRIHGVAFDSQLITAKLNDFSQNNGREELINSNARVINNSYGIAPQIKKDANGRNMTLPGGVYDYVTLDPQATIASAIASRNNLERDSTRPIPSGRYETSAVLLRAARAGKLIVYSAGNYNNYNIPEVSKSLPYAFPDMLDHYLNVVNITRTDQLHITSSSCGHTASFCLSAPGYNIESTIGTLRSTTGGQVNRDALQKGELTVDPGYGLKTGTSMAAPHASGAAAVLMQRFPWMSADQIAVVLKTTATDLGAPGIDNMFGWGKINLRAAVDGPMMFATREDIPAEFYVPGSLAQTQFVANVPGQGAVVEAGTSVERICDSPECAFDSWGNNISGHGGLTKTGDGTLELSGQNSYSGPTIVEQGGLLVNSSVSSAVTVEQSGTLSGSGSVGQLWVDRGGVVAPGNGIGMLRVDSNVVFVEGSGYSVEVARGGRSDRIEAERAFLLGGNVNVSLENRQNLLSQPEAESLLGEKYTIISTSDGVSGTFDVANPAYPFVRVALDYREKEVGLGIERTDAAFASLAGTSNERAVAQAVESLGVSKASVQPVSGRIEASDAATTDLAEASSTEAVAEPEIGHPVYESFLGFTSAQELQQATRKLSGQIHADVAASQLSESRHLRDTAVERLRQAAGQRAGSEIKADGGAWAKLLGSWGRASGTGNATGYQSETYGVLLGVDGAVREDTRLGVMTGYTRTSLDGGHGSNADSDNWHLGLYGDHRIGALALRAGGGMTWLRIDTRRYVAYGAQSDHEKAKYNAHTGQLFAEGAWTLSGAAGSLEPFANLTWAEYRSDSFAERGGAAALGGGKQSTSSTASTLGLRADAGWEVKSVAVALRGELGWQHQLDGRKRDAQLAFRHTDAGFNVGSVPVSRDAAVVKAGVEVSVNENAALSLGYGGQLSKRNQDNSVNAGFNWYF